MSASALPRLVGAILAGGRSSRFGGAPKGLARVGGARLVDRAAAALGSVCDDLVLVAHAPDAAAWLPGARVVADVRPGLGALGGVHAALAHAGAAVIVVAWDMPFVPASLLAELRDVGRRGADAVVPVGDDGPEPLCAFYGPRCLAAAGALLDRGERRARALAESVDTVWLAADRLARHGDPAVTMLSVNAPADLARAEALSRAAVPPV